MVGTYGIVVLDARHPDRVVAARNGSPVVLGIGDKEMFVASDVAALVRYTRQVVHLDDGEVATVRADGFRTATLDARTTTKEPSTIDTDAASYDADGYAHFMLKEIHEQPRAVQRALRGRLDERFHTAHLGGLNMDARASCGRSAGSRSSAAAPPTTRARWARSSSRTWRGSRPTRSPPPSSATATR